MPNPQNDRFPIESLLSARRLVSPQLCEDRIYFASDFSGVISLYRIERDGSIPEPLLPAGLALQNPHLLEGTYLFHVLPKLQKILVMIDNNGDENYQPCFVPLDGGIPEPIFGDKYRGEQMLCMDVDSRQNFAYFRRDDRKTPDIECLQVKLDKMDVKSLGKSIYGNNFMAANRDHSHVITADSYTAADDVLFHWRDNGNERQLLFGTPLEKRVPSQEVKLTGFNTASFTDGDSGLVIKTTLFRDAGGLAYFSLANPGEPTEVPILDLKHTGQGELVGARHVDGDEFLLEYNIDGCSWLYQAQLHKKRTLNMEAKNAICGLPSLSNGVLQGYEFELGDRKQKSPEYVFSFTKATTPSQLYLFSPDASRKIEKQLRVLSNERILGIDRKYLSEGEDASYKTFDGLRVSARLYMPSKDLGIEGPRPLVMYVHGGPQSQERPDFTWFSMPLIQYLTLNGFAVFVPNVRGSTGYGLKYMKMVDRDWGGNDRLDQIEGLKMLEKDPRVDSSRRAVVGRSYGGYMTLTLVSRHPELWKAGCDMFGPYDLIGFLNSLPETWKTAFYLSLGHPDKDNDFLLERSPKTYFDDISCPMLIIQGKNDPRVVKAETDKVVEQLRARKLEVEYLTFEDEGHDVLKFKNRVTCYTKIADFFRRHLMEGQN
jgi:pimeloyl-ACP methyl ester carboxylesterase